MHAQTRRSVSAASPRFVLLTVVVSLLLTGATTTGASQDGPQVNPQIVTTHLFEMVLARGDFATMAAIVAPDVLIHTPEGEFRGYTGMVAFGDTLGAAFSGISFAASDPIVEQEMMSLRWSMSGNHTGSYHGVAATCTFVSISGVTTLRLDGSRIAEQWFDYDRMALVSQLEALSAVDTHSQGACSPVSPPNPEPTIPPCGPECDKPHGNR
jgi:predicted ester cyclase